MHKRCLEGTIFTPEDGNWISTLPPHTSAFLSLGGEVLASLNLSSPLSTCWPTNVYTIEYSLLHTLPGSANSCKMKFRIRHKYLGSAVYMKLCKQYNPYCMPQFLALFNGQRSGSIELLIILIPTYLAVTTTSFVNIVYKDDVYYLELTDW